MFHNMDLYKDLKANITPITEDRVAVEILLKEEVSLGVLYYERPKAGWTNKPVMPTRWRCVDAKVEGVKVWGGDDISPKDLMVWAQEKVYEYHSKGDISSHTH